MFKNFNTYIKGFNFVSDKVNFYVSSLKFLIMKKLIILMFFIVLALRMFGQSAERYVISPCGGSYYSGSSLAIDYTSGELAISTVGSLSNILTQGFQQPFFNKYVSVPEVQDNNLQVSVYPNPVVDRLGIMIRNAPDQNCRVFIYDMLGQLMKDVSSNASYGGTINIDIDLNNIPTGNYFVRVIQNKKILTTQKIIKIKQ